MSASSDPVELATRLVGGVWGHLVGDAVGVPYEFRSAAQIAASGPVRFGATGSHGQPPGTWSDDGALMLALLDSLLAPGGFDVEDQGRRSVAWWRDGAYTPDPGKRPFDIGNATRSALEAIEGGAPASSAGRVDDMACGNGSLMRILPIALVAAAAGKWDDGTLMEQAHAASRVTHGHPRAQVACSLYVLVAARLLAGEHDRAAALEYAAEWHRSWMVEKLEVTGQPAATGAAAAATGEPAATGAAMREAFEHLMAWPERQGRGSVWDSFWSAWDAFEGAGNYQEAIERAIACGNDTDTTAAIAGGLAGIYWGIDGIPAEWHEGMRGREVAGPLVDGLLAKQGWRTSTGNPIRVDWVDLVGVARFVGIEAAGGQLGMTFLPGKQRDGWTGLHWRDLRVDAARLRGVLGVDTLLLLVEDHELEAARVPDIAAIVAEADIELLRFPIIDMTVTPDRGGLRLTLDHVLGRLADGQTVVIACRGGMGRTGTIVGCLLRDGGLDADTAIALTRASRKNTIERETQEDFVASWDWPAREALR